MAVTQGLKHAVGGVFALPARAIEPIMLRVQKLIGARGCPGSSSCRT